jgi:hypothetical protein
VAEGVEATVSPTVRETTEAVSALLAGRDLDAETTVAAVAKYLLTPAWGSKPERRYATPAP